MSVTTAGAIRAVLEDAGKPFRIEPANGNQWQERRAPLPLGDPFEPLRRPFHLFQDSRVDRPERYIVGGCGEGRFQFGVVMRAEAQPQPGPPDRRKIGLGEIVLAEMNEIRAFLARRQ